MDHLEKSYRARVNRVLDHIEKHITDELPVAELAGIAHFSPFHFHRVFHALMGEPVGRFITRVRLEKAAMQLVTYPDRPVTEIALDCGYGSSGTFSRAFRSWFGVSPTAWRQSKIGTHEGNLRQAMTVAAAYPPEQDQRSRRNEMTVTSQQVKVETLDAWTVAYIRHVGPYQGDGELFASLFGRLFQWAGPRGLMNPPETKVMSIYHDDPNITDPEKQRVTVALSVPTGTKVSGEVGTMDLPGGLYACAHFELSGDEYGAAWDWVYGTWLPESGYEPDDRPCFELYLNSPEEHPEHKHILDICIPVRAAD